MPLLLIFCLYNVINIVLLSSNDTNAFIFWKIGCIIVNSKWNILLILSTIVILIRNKCNSWLFTTLIILNLDLNQFNNTLNNFNFNFTQSLTNGFFVLHPLLISFIYINLIYFIFTDALNFKQILNLSIVSVKKRDFNAVYIISILAIFLGSWWANQELGWGGWWSWDMVELINFFFLLLTIRYAHIKKCLNNASIDSIRYCTLTFIIFLHVSVRYDIFNSIHSFISNNPLEYVNLFKIASLQIFLYFKLSYVNKKFVNLSVFLFSSLVLLTILNFIFIFYYIPKFYFYTFILLEYIFTSFLIISLFRNLNSFNILIVFTNPQAAMLNSFKILKKSKWLPYVNHLIIFLIIVYSLSNFTNDFYSSFSFTVRNSTLLLNDISYLSNAYISNIYINLDVVDSKKYISAVAIPFYQYVSNYRPFINMYNMSNLSFIQNYLDLYFYIIFITILMSLKNIVRNKFNNYKIWCI